MKKLSSFWGSVLALLFTLSSCEVAGGIFKAGMWTMLIIIILVVVLIVWLVNRGKS